MTASGLPVVTSEGARPRLRISFGAPLPAGMRAEGELIDVVLSERWPIWRVRDAIEAHVPGGWRIVALEDVWLGGPPIAGRVSAADYRIELEPVSDTDALVAVAADLVRADRIERHRTKGGSVVSYDLRPLIMRIEVAQGPQGPVVTTRTRFHPELGTGRPEEVIAALGERSVEPLVTRSFVRERLVLDRG